MKIRLVSDVHTEFMARDLHKIDKIVLHDILPELPTDKETTLLLAGDIGSQSKIPCLKAFLDHVTQRFEDVLYIPGNHESYGGNVNNAPIYDLTRKYKNVLFGQWQTFEPNAKLKIVGCTLWTDCNKDCPVTVSRLKYGMNDYRLIEIGKGHILDPIDTMKMHKEHLEVLEKEMKEGCVVFTHHSPSFQSTHEKYKHDHEMNGGYCSSLEELILRKKPKLWMHGHLHDPVDYMIGETRILSNPRGYRGEGGLVGYRPELLLEI